RRGAAVGEDRPRCLEAAAVGGDRGAGAAAPYLDPLDRGVAEHLTALRPQPPHQGGGDVPRPALGDRVAVLLAKPAEDPAEEAATGTVGGEVGMEGVAGDQPGGALSAELLLGHPPRRQQREA